MKRVLFPAVIAVLSGIVISLQIPLPRRDLEPWSVTSLRVVDRKGILLREVLSDLRGRGRWVSIEEVSPPVIIATLAAEDANFFLHRGIDPLGLARAVLKNLRARRIVSGGSTISQQTARLIYRIPRTIPGKLLEIWLALRLEHTLGKAEVLEQYLNRAPYGNLNYGIEAASRFYFGKPAEDLSLAEAAFLAGIPRGPSYLNPYFHFDRAKRRQEHILRLMLERGFIDESSFRRAMDQDIELVPPDKNFEAPHFVEYVLRQIRRRGVAVGGEVKTTLDLRIQKACESILRAYVKSLEDKNVTNGAILVVDNESGEILAWVGSADPFDTLHDGQVDGVLALRQPGSALKPFTYGIALESGMTPASIIPDIPSFVSTGYGDFTPRNYDESYHGPVRLRQALACSYNVPAVRVLERFGPEVLLERLHRAGFSSLDKEPGYYGLALTLGAGEVRLYELVRAYRALARGGVYTPLHFLLDNGDSLDSEEEDSSKIVFSRQIAFLLTDILSDGDARAPAFGDNSPLDLPFPCAVKTGTSKDYRDNWTVGYTTKYTVGVWVGNFSGEPMHGVSGITGAGPIFRDVMLYLHRENPPPPFPVPRGLVRATICTLSGKLAGPHCEGRRLEWFIKGTEPKDTCDWHYLVPGPEGDRIAIRYPPEFRAWGQYIGADCGEPLEEARVAAKEVDTSFALRIIYPDEGDVFIIDPFLRRSFQALEFRALVPYGVREVEWRIDGRGSFRSRAPFTFRWQLSPGEHELVLTAGGRSDTVHFRVLD